MTKKNKNTVIIMSVVFYIFAVALMIIGSKNDLAIDLALFNPQSKFAIFMEAFGQFVYWSMWGPLFSVLFVTAHGLNECLDIIGRIFPFIKPIQNTGSKLFTVFDRLVLIVWKTAFFVLADIGWKKLIENVLKQFVDLSQAVYFIICAVVSLISILLVSRLDKKLLYRLEGLALAGIVFGICCKIVENCKGITHRIRFREMVAWSNGITEEKDGAILSCGKVSQLQTQLSRSMADKTDFSAFTQWFKKGDDMGIYSHPDSFPSGHTTYSCTMFLSVLVCRAFDKLKRFAPIAFITSFLYVILMGYSRMLAGAHYLTDVAGGAIVGYTLFLFVCGLYALFNKKNILPTRAL